MVTATSEIHRPRAAPLKERPAIAGLLEVRTSETVMARTEILTKQSLQNGLATVYDPR